MIEGADDQRDTPMESGSQQLSTPLRLTQYSHGAGCGCKIAPGPLGTILTGLSSQSISPRVLVGAGARDDAAVYALDEIQALVSTVDFFMPVVDDAATFGAIAAVNALSDVYAMGAVPVIALAVLGWPIQKLPLSAAAAVLRGASDACQKAGCSIVGGHSIDAPEPMFGLAVTGIGNISRIRKNADARVGCELFLTKPLGVGIITTAQKRGKVSQHDFEEAVRWMLTLNKIGPQLAELECVATMTDVTGFGLLGHLIEICQASGVTAVVSPENIPILDGLDAYVRDGIFPGGTTNNFKSYGDLVDDLTDLERTIMCDPQTSGGLLVAVRPTGRDRFLRLAQQHDLTLTSFGVLTEKSDDKKIVKVSRKR